MRDNKTQNEIYAGVAELADALDLGSSVHRRAGSSPVTRTIKIDNTLVLSIFIIPAKRWQDLKVTVKKTVRWTVFREGVDASFLSYLCLISEVDSSERRKYVTHNHKEKYIGTSLFLYTTSKGGQDLKVTKETWKSDKYILHILNLPSNINTK